MVFDNFFRIGWMAYSGYRMHKAIHITKGACDKIDSVGTHMKNMKIVISRAWIAHFLSGTFVRYCGQ